MTTPKDSSSRLENAGISTGGYAFTPIGGKVVAAVPLEDVWPGASIADFLLPGDAFKKLHKIDGHVITIGDILANSPHRS